MVAETKAQKWNLETSQAAQRPGPPAAPQSSARPPLFSFRTREKQSLPGGTNASFRCSACLFSSHHLADKTIEPGASHGTPKYRSWRDAQIEYGKIIPRLFSKGNIKCKLFFFFYRQLKPHLAKLWKQRARWGYEQGGATTFSSVKWRTS